MYKGTVCVFFDADADNPALPNNVGSGHHGTEFLL